MKTLITARRVALGVALLASAIALSSTPETGRVTVDYRDLDMSRPEAAQVLYRRISMAARRVCNQPPLRDLTATRAFNYCYRTAIENAVEKVNDRTLTALHRSKAQRTAAG